MEDERKIPEKGGGTSDRPAGSLGGSKAGDSSFLVPGGSARDSWTMSDELLVGASARDELSARRSEAARATAFSTLFVEVDMTDAVSLREHLRERWERSYGVRLTLYHLVLKAAAVVLKENPTLDLGSEENGMRQWGRVNIGMSILLEDEMVRVVLRNANSLSLAEIATQAARLAERAAERRLADEESSPGNFAVSNLGKCGIDSMALLPEPPEKAILGVGRCVKKPVVVEDELRLRWLMILSLAFDRGTVGEGKAARFLSLVVDLLERPSLLLI